MRASMRWIQQCKPLQRQFAPLLCATIWPFNSRWMGAFSNARMSERALCCSRRRNAVFVASRIIQQKMSDFWYFVGSSDYEPYRWYLSDFNIAMWLLIPAVFRGKLHFHWGGKQRMYDINSGVLIPVNQRPQWREVRRLEFGLNDNLVHCYDCKLSVLTFVQRTFGPERWREGSAQHGKCNDLRL